MQVQQEEAAPAPEKLAYLFPPPGDITFQGNFDALQTYICIYICVCVCVYIYIYIYIRQRIYLYIYGNLLKQRSHNCDALAATLFARVKQVQTM